jgi:light-regulated signal transduction histidine kinase (bacteriophytochrome)
MKEFSHPGADKTPVDLNRAIQSTITVATNEWKYVADIRDPFFTTKQVGKGTGQGLAIAHDVIVNKHAGSIALESEPGKGSTFIIKLPINPAEPQAQTARVA